MQNKIPSLLLLPSAPPSEQPHVGLNNVIIICIFQKYQLAPYYVKPPPLAGIPLASIRIERVSVASGRVWL